MVKRQIKETTYALPSPASALQARCARPCKSVFPASPKFIGEQLSYPVFHFPPLYFLGRFWGKVSLLRRVKKRDPERNIHESYFKTSFLGQLWSGRRRSDVKKKAFKKSLLSSTLGTVGYISHDPCFHVYPMEAGLMTFVAHDCTKKVLKMIKHKIEKSNWNIKVS